MQHCSIHYIETNGLVGSDDKSVQRIPQRTGHVIGWMWLSGDAASSE